MRRILSREGCCCWEKDEVRGTKGGSGGGHGCCCHCLSVWSLKYQEKGEKDVEKRKEKFVKKWNVGEKERR